MEISKKQIAYALSSFLLGVWTFVKVNSISGPAFEPILAACTNPDIAPDDFASKTGYHAYEPRVGFGIFNFLVCLITQFLLELRNTYPAGILVWGGVVVVALPASIMISHEAGRIDARGPVRYAMVIGILSQLLGISVVFPMIWIPSFILGQGKNNKPLTVFRIIFTAVTSLPATILSAVVFLAPTDSYLWTVCAGTLGGPLLPMLGFPLSMEIYSSITATAQNVTKSYNVARTANILFMFVGFIEWLCLISISYQSYGTSIRNLWKDIWVDANSSVAFMTIDTGVLYLGVLIAISYRDVFKALKALFLTPLLGPATAPLLVMQELDDKRMKIESQNIDSKQD